MKKEKLFMNCMNIKRGAKKTVGALSLKRQTTYLLWRLKTEIFGRLSQVVMKIELLLSLRLIITEQKTT